MEFQRDDPAVSANCSSFGPSGVNADDGGRKMRGVTKRRSCNVIRVFTSKCHMQNLELLWVDMEKKEELYLSNLNFNNKAVKLLNLSFT